MTTVGVLLAGGKSARMGRDKGALTAHAGDTLGARAVAALRAVCDRVVCVGHGRGVPDDVARIADPGDGPLVALAHAAADPALRDADVLVVLAVDMPDVDAPLLARLLDARARDDAAAACLIADNHDQDAHDRAHDDAHAHAHDDHAHQGDSHAPPSAPNDAHEGGHEDAHNGARAHDGRAHQADTHVPPSTPSSPSAPPAPPAPLARNARTRSGAAEPLPLVLSRAGARALADAAARGERRFGDAVRALAPALVAVGEMPGNINDPEAFEAWTRRGAGR